MICPCGIPNTDTDGDDTPDCQEQCDTDPNKTVPGVCGCGVADTDTDDDGLPDCQDTCPTDPLKITPGACGCGVIDNDTDGDDVADCIDGCPMDPDKIAPGTCGCLKEDADYDNDGNIMEDCDPIYPCMEDSDCPTDEDNPWLCDQEFCTTEPPNLGVSRRRGLRRRLQFSPPIFCYCYNPSLDVGRMPTAMDDLSKWSSNFGTSNKRR
jgi:hypothetical protein